MWESGVWVDKWSLYTPFWDQNDVILYYTKMRAYTLARNVYKYARGCVLSVERKQIKRLFVRTYIYVFIRVVWFEMSARSWKIVRATRFNRREKKRRSIRVKRYVIEKQFRVLCARDDKSFYAPKTRAVAQIKSLLRPTSSYGSAAKATRQLPRVRLWFIVRTSCVWRSPHDPRTRFEITRWPIPRHLQPHLPSPFAPLSKGVVCYEDLFCEKSAIFPRV